MARRVRTKNTAPTFSVHPPVVSLHAWMAEQYRKYPSLKKRVAKRLKEMEAEQRASKPEPTKRRTR